MKTGRIKYCCQKNYVNEVEKNEWWLFCDNFINLAKLGCLEMLNQKYPKLENFPKKTMAFWKFDLYIATVYNLKHSIEIFLKFLCIIIKHEFPEFKGKGHDVEFFLNLFKDDCNLNTITFKLNEAVKKNSKSRYATDVACKISMDSSKMLDDIAEICLKYFYMEDISHKINNRKIKDLHNTAYKYPRNKLPKINYSQIVHSITDEDVKTVLSDIYKLEKAINPLTFIINAYNDIKSNKEF